MTRLSICSLVLLIVQCSALQYEFETPVDPTECALLLNTHSDANILNSIFPYQPTQTCITYDAVNQAYIEARKRTNVKMAHGEEWEPAQVASVGELLLDISAQLAKTYGMNIEDIEKGLPLIDTSKTLIKEVCPGFLSEVACEPGKYRRHDGLCNNLQNPSWGAINTPFTRLMSPQFADGMTHPRESVLGSQLPLPRIVSRTIHPDEGYHDHAGTVMVVAWGQFMDHDFTLTATPLDRRTKNEPEECCHRPPHLKHPYCMDIVIPEDDYFYSKLGVTCQDFVRSFPAVRPGCRLGSRTPFNTLTGVIDGNTVYGVTEGFARHLRDGYGGLLRMNPVFNEYGLKDLLPLKVDIPEEGCTRANGSEFCFEAGEIRVNEQLVLACMHTLMAREHNRLAKELAKINPHWDDETLYQEARRIVIAQIQHITFNEFLPIILGKEVMQKFGLMLEKDSYWDGYDPEVNPNIIDAFSAAAFRFGHSLLPTAVERWSKAHQFIASKRLSDLIRRPYDLYRPGVMDEYIMGLMNQVAQAMDDSITQEVTNHLLKKPGQMFGMDLVAFNMQRGREFGVPGYMYFRKFCGLPVTESFEELFGSMPNTTVYRYSQIFEHIMDIDLWSGGVSEKPLPGSMVGPTFACVIATQMSYIRRGDRFWYELPNQPSSFTPEQLQEIRKTKLSRIVCDNTDLIDTIQVYPMVLPDHEINPRVPCKSGILPSIDLTKWAEYPQSHLHTNDQILNISITNCNGDECRDEKLIQQFETGKNEEHPQQGDNAPQQSENIPKQARQDCQGNDCFNRTMTKVIYLNHHKKEDDANTSTKNKRYVGNEFSENEKSVEKEFNKNNKDAAKRFTRNKRELEVVSDHSKHKRETDSVSAPSEWESKKYKAKQNKSKNKYDGSEKVTNYSLTDSGEKITLLIPTNKGSSAYSHESTESKNYPKYSGISEKSYPKYSESSESKTYPKYSADNLDGPLKYSSESQENKGHAKYSTERSENKGHPNYSDESTESKSYPKYSRESTEETGSSYFKFPTKKSENKPPSSYIIFSPPKSSHVYSKSSKSSESPTYSQESLENKDSSEFKPSPYYSPKSETPKNIKYSPELSEIKGTTYYLPKNSDETYTTQYYPKNAENYFKPIESINSHDSSSKNRGSYSDESSEIHNPKYLEEHPAPHSESGTYPGNDGTYSAESSEEIKPLSNYYNKELNPNYINGKENQLNDQVYSIHGLNQGAKVPAYKWADYQKTTPKPVFVNYRQADKFGKRKPFYSAFRPTSTRPIYRNSYKKPRNRFRDSLSSFGSFTLERIPSTKFDLSTTTLKPVLYDPSFFSAETMKQLDLMLKEKGPEMDKLLKGSIQTQPKFVWKFDKTKSRYTF